MKKKIFSILFTMCLILPCMFMLIACTEEEPCDHEWDIKNNPTATTTGLAFCTACNRADLVMPTLNDTDYTVVGTNPDYKEYTYIKDGENLEFVVTNFDFTYSSTYGGDGGYCINDYTGNSTTIVIPDTVKYIHGTLPVVEISGDVFSDNTSITSVTLPSGLKKIGNSFSGCTSLSSINLPNGLDVIGTYAFSSTALTEVVIPNTVSIIGTGSFENCNSLQKISIPFIGDVNIPDTYKYFGTIFGDANSNGSVPTSLKEVAITGNITSIISRAFSECTSIEKITLPDTVTLIGTESFKDCTSLEDIVLGSAITKINPEAFSGCTSLEELVIPSTLTNIDNSAFLGCTSLDTVYYMGTKNQWSSIDINPTNDNNQYIENADRYYYMETQPTAIDYLNNNKVMNMWHYGTNNDISLWTINFTDNTDGNTYEYHESIVELSDEYWSMLKAAESQGMIEEMFAIGPNGEVDQELLNMYTTSANKSEYEEKLATYYANTATALTISFADGTMTMAQSSDSTTLQYIEVDNEIYYVSLKEKAFNVDTTNATVYEEHPSDYFNIKHIYTLVEE